MGIQDIPDDQLKALYSKSQAPDISKLSDEDLRAMYAKISPPDTSMSHYAGLGARMVAEGAPSIFDLPARVQGLMKTALNIPASYIASGIQHLKGNDISPEEARQLLGFIESKMPGQFAAPTDYISKGLDAVGVPKPNPGPETIAFDTGKALMGVGGSYGLGASGLVGDDVGKLLTLRPANQLMSAGLGAASASTAKEAGLGPGAQLAAGLVGGIGVPTAISTAGTAAGTVYDAAKGFLQKPEDAVGQTLRTMANDPEAAIQAMQSAPEYVPNSPMTTGEASGDRGLIGAQMGMRNSDPAAKTAFGTLEAAQNEARNKYLDTIAGTPADLAAAIKARDLKGAQLRQAAFENAQPVDISGVKGQIADVLNSPSGAQEAVEHGMNWAAGRLNKLNPITESVDVAKEGPFGEPLTETQTKVLGYPAESAYSVRKDIADAVQGKFQQDNPLLVHAGSQLKGVRGAIDEAIENAAPGYKDYLSTYSEMSKPIDQMEALQELRERVLGNAIQDPTTKLPVFSPAQYGRYLQSNAEDLNDILTDEQKTGLNNLHNDLQRTQSTWAPTVRTVNSSTAMNINQQKAAAEILAEKVKSIPYIGNQLYQSRKDALNEALLNSLLSPKTATELMTRAKNATPMVPVSDIWKQKMLANLLGGGVAATQ